jgi:hypothetical protein
MIPILSGSPWTIVFDRALRHQPVPAPHMPRKKRRPLTLAPQEAMFAHTRTARSGAR